MKEFNLEAAKAGAPVCTRDGRKARIICFDAQFGNDFFIVALIIFPGDGEEILETYNKEGRAYGSNESVNDLVMATVKKEGWVRLVPNEDEPGFFAQIHATEEEAREQCKRHDFVAHIEWEE